MTQDTLVSPRSARPEPEPMVHAAPSPTPGSVPTARLIAVASVVALAAGGGPALLLRLAQFGQQPPERLPTVAVLLFGTLLIGPLADLVAAASPRRRAWVIAWVAALASVTTAVLTATAYGDLRHVLAPAATALGTGALARMRPPHAGRGRFLAASAAYVAATLLANYTLDSFLPIGGFFLVNVGTLFFGITFTQRDRIHPYGRRAVYGVIALAAVGNVALASALGTPLRYVVVSFLTILIAESADTEVYQRLLRRRWLTRVAASNAVSAPLDTIVFTLLAFWGEPFATSTWLLQVIATDVLVKYASGLAAALGMVALLRSLLPSLGPGLEPPDAAPTAPAGN